MLKSKVRFLVAALALPAALLYWPFACSAPTSQLKATGPEPSSSAETLHASYSLPPTVAGGVLPHPAFAFADSAASASIADIAERVTPSVVSITSERMVDASQRMMPFPFGFGFGGPGQGGPQKQQGLGSGVIISQDGVVLTNHHVIEDATEIKVTTSDDREFEAQLIGSDKKSDLAVLRLKGDLASLKALPIGDSTSLRLGDVVLAVGNPFGVGQTVTMGIVSAKGRSNMGINDYEDFIQTDAAINPGNSGGALVNMRGELVGINTAILSRSGGYQGIGFAIPTNMARPIADSLLSKGRVVRGFLGIGIQDLDAELGQALKVPDNHGVLVTDVQPGGAADKAGVKARDVILKVDGSPVTDTGHLRNMIASRGVNVPVTLSIIRDGKPAELKVTLTEMPEEAAKAGKESQATSPTLGMKLAPLDERLRHRLQMPDNAPGKVVVVGVEPDSRADEAGLHPGDVLVEIDQKPVTSVAQVETAAKAAKGPLLLGVRRGEGTRYVVIKPQ
jgi:serine protease Do